MSNLQVENEILVKAKSWLQESFDEETRIQVKSLIENDPTGLTEAFYRNLEFGTGGLRGIMGVGTNRMNKYTVGMATQGLANYLLKMFPGSSKIKVAIAHDSRNNSSFFAQISANVLSANGIFVYLFDSLRPTPELSFAVRYLHCQAGIVITASHNPPEYNGYKAYWEDGGQLIKPHDVNVITEVNNIGSLTDVRFDPVKENINIIGEEIDNEYLNRLKGLSLSPDIIRKHKNIKIVYTPLHGTGVQIVPRALGLFGFSNIMHVPEQDIPDGNFPTVKSPNPEESAALSLAIEKAKETDADLVLATDPDADRVGAAIRTPDGNYKLLNGNQTASLLIYYLVTKWKENNKLTGKEYIVKTIVTSEILREIAIKNGVHCFDTLTGFKYIAELIRLNEGKMTFIGGGEESYGYLVGDFVRDKDAVISCCMIAEVAAWAKEKNITLGELLPLIYKEYGFYKEKLHSVTRKGKEGAEEIAAMMDGYRKNPPAAINGSRILTIKDYTSRIEKDLIKQTEKAIELPKSDVLQFILEDGSKISVRPSGTEPKIKFYFSVFSELANVGDYYVTDNILDSRIEGIIRDMRLL